MKTMKQMALEFGHAFERPVNESVVPLTVSERELLGKLIFEEVVEYVTLGLGLKIVADQDMAQGNSVASRDSVRCYLEIDEGQSYDPIESADGLGDINVLVHFNSLWHGFDIDAVTREIHLSNMSKLDGMGKPIINQCNVCPDPESCDIEHHLIDPTKPVGKILKGPNFFKPDIARVIGV
jgi:predicted HAD superfamily Cof-like phosphohydrolase